MFQLHFQHNVWNAETLCSDSNIQRAQPAFVQQALSFCHAWLTGEHIFQMQTSGSTGVPKSIELTRQQLQASAQGTGNFFRLTPEDTALVCLDPTYIAGKMMLLRAMEFEMKAILVEPSRNPFVQPSPLHPVPTFFAFVPLQLQEIFAANLTDQLAQARAILIGGAPISASLLQKIKTVELPIYQTYGMTETASHIALRKLPEETEYTTLPNVEIAIDSRGCLQVKGAVTQHRWLTTNDLVQLKSRRQFHWLGRFDNIINTGGVKIPSERIEEAVKDALAAERIKPRELMVASLPSEQWGEAICLVLEGTSLQGNQEKRIKDYVRDTVHRYAVPKHLIYVDKIPQTATQKHNRQKVKELLPQWISNA